jgi:hypothetical protein
VILIRIRTWLLAVPKSVVLGKALAAALCVIKFNGLDGMPEGDALIRIPDQFEWPKQKCIIL